MGAVGVWQTPQNLKLKTVPCESLGSQCFQRDNWRFFCAIWARQFRPHKTGTVRPATCGGRLNDRTPLVVVGASLRDTAALHPPGNQAAVAGQEQGPGSSWHNFELTSWMARSGQTSSLFMCPPPMFSAFWLFSPFLRSSFESPLIPICPRRWGFGSYNHLVIGRSPPGGGLLVFSE